MRRRPIIEVRQVETGPPLGDHSLFPLQEGGVVSEVREKVQSARPRRAGVRGTKVSARPRRAEVQDTKTKTRPGAPGQKEVKVSRKVKVAKITAANLRRGDPTANR